jgi:hypothetical protein
MRLVAAMSVLALPALADGCPEAPDISDAMAPLYERLQAAPDERTAQLITNEMWGLWDDAPDEPSQMMLDEGMRARASYDFLRALDRFDSGGYAVGPVDQQGPSEGDLAPGQNRPVREGEAKAFAQILDRLRQATEGPHEGENRMGAVACARGCAGHSAHAVVARCGQVERPRRDDRICRGVGHVRELSSSVPRYKYTNDAISYT